MFFSVYLESTVLFCWKNEVLSHRYPCPNFFLQVLPSLDISIQLTPCPSKLREFLVRMDIMNRTSTESFSMQQLSCVGDQLGISTLPRNESICSSKVLHAGQALSCFFKLKVCASYMEIFLFHKFELRKKRDKWRSLMF